MSKEILENNFNTIYKEYKDYKNFVEKITPEIAQSRKDFRIFALENKDNLEKVTDKLFEVNQAPAFYQKDLFELSKRLIYVYRAVKDSIEVPEDIKEEILSLTRPKFVYKIVNGEAVDIDPSYTEKIKKETKKSYTDAVQGFIKK